MLALKPFLQRHGISQAKLADALNLSPAMIAQWLNHEQWPSTLTIGEFSLTVIKALKTLGIEYLDTELFNSIPTASTAGTKNDGTAEPVPTLTQEVADMLLRKQTLTQQARKQFGLFRDPFDNDVQDADDVYLTPDIRMVREYLWTTAKLGGFMAVCGESGAGKSTLRRDLADRIAREEAPIIIMEPYVLGMEDNDKKGKTLKAAAIADAMIASIAPLERPRASMEAKSRQLHRLLKDSRRAGFSHCLIIEEAHGLSVPTLKHLKRFFELEDGFKKLVSIVLIGQTELKTKLAERAPEVREVVQRCELVELPPLDAHLESYLKFKFDRIGKPIDDVFDRDAYDGIRARLIFQKSAKNTRETVSLMYPLMVNNLVTAALNAAAQLGFSRLSADLIKEV